VSYSIFEETMADMSFREIEAAVKANAAVLFPIGVIEEHGPHMCLGTDTYLAHALCRKVKERLAAAGVSSLIAPPYYWGINTATASFAGSFNVRRSTMKTVLVDLLCSLKNWGFERVFLLNFHGDYHHWTAILEAARDARIDYGAGVHAVVADIDAPRLGLTGREAHVVFYRTAPQEGEVPRYVDLHAGAGETGLMALNFPDLVDVDLARTLESSRTTVKDLKVWSRGWSDAKRVTPLGYCGDPSALDLEKAGKEEETWVLGAFEAVMAVLKDEYRAPPSP
jgi:creatinine amidohydrolase